MAYANNTFAPVGGGGPAATSAGPGVGAQSQNSPINCPDGQHDGGGGHCVPDYTNPNTPPDNSSGECPEGTPGGYAACCPDGPNGQRVWRPDTKTCEYEDDRQKRGEDTCRDNGGQPINCGPGKASWCNFTTGRQECVNSSGGGGGGKGGGAFGRPAEPAPDPALAQSQTIWQEILKRLQAPSRYTPEVMQSLAGETKMGTEMQANRLTEQSNADLASRGMLRSGPAAAAQRGIRSDVSGMNLQGWNQILRAKVDADYTDKTQAIKEGMDWVNSLRDYIARSAATQAQKDSAMANVQLGYARLAQEMEQLRESYAQQLSLLQISHQYD